MTSIKSKSKVKSKSNASYYEPIQYQYSANPGIDQITSNAKKQKVLQKKPCFIQQKVFHMSLFHTKDLEKAVKFCNEFSKIRSEILNTGGSTTSASNLMEFAGDFHDLNIISKFVNTIMISLERDIHLTREWSAQHKFELTDDLYVIVDGCNRVMSGRSRFLAFEILSGVIEFRRLSIVQCGHSKSRDGGAIKILNNSRILMNKLTFVNCNAKRGSIYIGENGKLSTKGCVFLHCTAEEHGSCIFNCGYAILDNSTFSYCRSNSGCGGAVFNSHGASIDIKNCDFRQCHAFHKGGAVFNSRNSLVLLSDNNWESNTTTNLTSKAAAFYQEM